jgi:elongation factor 3
MNPGGGMKKITSKLSLASMGSFETDYIDTVSTVVSDSKRGKISPPEAREGCLLFIRALVEIVGKSSEPFVVPLLAAALEECSSSSSAVREAAEDTTKSIISLANGHAVPLLIFPVLFEALHSPDWRVKTIALQQMSETARIHNRQTSRLLPKIIPVVTSQVWDTKPQVTKAAKDALLACCQTNANPDVAPAIPALVQAICKPNDTVKAIDELKATTFVATVDASTLSILCPVLSRGLKDKLAINKRSCCIVIENMSRLVETPEAVAPFGPLLVPELKKVAENVQFEEIRDAALAALGALTKALGHTSIDTAISAIMKEESERIEAEQKRIEEERAAEMAREEELKRKEEEERILWKEAMEAQRQLNALALKEEEEKKAEEKKKKELAMTGTKSSGGTCQSCGLKKCKRSCLFYGK